MAEDMLFQTRSQTIRAAKRAQAAQWFKDRRWRICTELTGPLESGGRAVRGEFWLKAPDEFQTPLGNRGRHGFVIQEIGPDGKDLTTRPVQFGVRTLREANRVYGSIINLPAPRGRGRPRKDEVDGCQ